MIHKTFVNSNEIPLARVTFTLPSNMWADSVHLVGDFNDWQIGSAPFIRDRDGKWTITVELQLDKVYQFRYLRDGQFWMNDSQADTFVPVRHGCDNFIVVTDPKFEKHRNSSLSDL